MTGEALHLFEREGSNGYLDRGYRRIMIYILRQRRSVQPPRATAKV